MSNSIKKLGSWDLFFYYGQNDLDLEIESDMVAICMQPPRSLYYNNLESAGMVGYENHPNELNMQVSMRYDIANGIAWKNTVVSNGTDNKPDRRVAVSQFAISFVRGVEGDLDCKILYIPYYNYTAYKVVNPPIVGLK